MMGLEGHRQRLRQRFLENPQGLSEVESLELLLTYAIPRQDVAPLARNLLDSYGSLPKIFGASISDLMNVKGIGESAAILIRLISNNMINSVPRVEMSPKKTVPQLNLFALESPVAETPIWDANQAKSKGRSMRVFANDEIATSLAMLPKASEFPSFDAFKQYLSEKLPYNSAETRSRRANYILERFYPSGNLDTPLTFYSTNCSGQDELKPVIFYHILKAEPIAAKVAEELIWPALPIGRIEREQIREFILRYLPDTKAASQAKILQAIFHTYDLPGVGFATGTTLRFQLRKGTLESFLYILTSEFPKPGMYSFDDLNTGPLHRWLLWDREWIRGQLYNLRDFGILSKVSEIDTMRQFSIALDQKSALQTYFNHPQRGHLAVREKNNRIIE